MKNIARQRVGQRADAQELKGQRPQPKRKVRLVQPVFALEHQRPIVAALHHVLRQRGIKNRVPLVNEGGEHHQRIDQQR